MRARKWTAADLPDLTGQTAVVTGATSGLGRATATELARAGATVVLAVRDVERGRSVASAMPGRTEVRELNLADLASVRAFAAGWAGPLAILLNNAGIMQVPEGRTADGFELQMGTNHLGPFALTNLLLPHITRRVVTVSSALHAGGHIQLTDLNSERRPYKSLQAYSDSKLANLLFTHELQRRLTEAGSAVRATAAHPGIASTNLNSHLGGLYALLIPVMYLLFNSAEQGALPTLYAATQDVPGGSFVGPDGLGHLRGHPVIQAPAAKARDARTARELWDLSARLTGTGWTLSGKTREPGVLSAD